MAWHTWRCCLCKYFAPPHSDVGMFWACFLAPLTLFMAPCQTSHVTCWPAAVVSFACMLVAGFATPQLQLQMVLLHDFYLQSPACLCLFVLSAGSTAVLPTGSAWLRSARPSWTKAWQRWSALMQTTLAGIRRTGSDCVRCEGQQAQLDRCCCSMLQVLLWCRLADIHNVPGVWMVLHVLLAAGCSWSAFYQGKSSHHCFSWTALVNSVSV